MDPRSILVELLRKFLPIGYRQYHSLFFVCSFEDSYALASKLPNEIKEILMKKVAISKEVGI